MHSLLGYRYDRLMHEQLLKKVNQCPPINLFSIRLMVKDLNREKDFFTQLLGIAPLVESSEYVVLQISPGITLYLTLYSVSSTRKKDRFPSGIGGLELNLETKDIQGIWKKALTIKGRKPSELIIEKNMLMFTIQSPVGMILRLWQRWTPELVE